MERGREGMAATMKNGKGEEGVKEVVEGGGSKITER